jgi:hypothetical protein
LHNQPLKATPSRHLHALQLNDEPGEQSGDDEQHHRAHSRSRSPVTSGTSRLPIAPPHVSFHVGDDRSASRHRRASWMVSNKSKFHAIPMTTAADTQSMAMTGLIDTSCMLEV